MRHLLNTLYIMTEDAYAALKNENVFVLQDDRKLGEVPLHTLENIIYFGYKGVSPALIGVCAKRGIGLCFMDRHGRFLARICGEERGNVILRKKQYRNSDDELESCKLARNFVIGKIYNERSVIERTKRDHPFSIDVGQFEMVSKNLKSSIYEARRCEVLMKLRGVEGDAAKQYFSVFNAMILQNKEEFFFHGREKRPPLDRVNAMLSFIYTILTHECASALESVGLDAYVGFLHRDRPGRTSLALDLVEELRAIYADRFVLTLINNRMIKVKHFQIKENGAVWLNDEGRKCVLQEWQNRKKEKLKHPFLQEKMVWGLVPYVQAQLLARHLRGDLDEYPAFLWK